MKNIAYVLFIVFTFTSCERHVEEDSLCDPDISFIQQVNPILVNNCVDCHKGNRFPDLRTHASISTNASNIKTQVVTRSMPQNGSLTNEEIELISCWIDNGALDN